METTQQNKTYQLGDFILFNDKEQKTKIGIIEDYNNEQKWYDCFQFLVPEQTPAGRMSHHGTSEVFKTNVWVRIEFSSIIKQVYVVKLREFQKLKEEKNVEDLYVMRQEYQMEALTFLPQLSKCLCGRFPSPDEILIMCGQCDNSYCASCPKTKLNSLRVFYCDSCKVEIPEAIINEKYKQSRSKTVSFANALGNGSQEKPKKKVDVVPLMIEDEEDEMDMKQKTPTIDLEKLQKKIKKNESIPLPPSRQSQNSNPTPIRIDLLQIQKPKQFKNISQEKIDKIIEWTEMYRANETSNPNMPKKRLDVREKLLQLLIYGVEEMRDLYDQDSAQLSPQEIQLIRQSDQILFMVLKKMVLEIEVSLHMKYNNLQRNELIDQVYLERCKLVYMHMKDDKNFDLRRKVLTREITASDLCNKDELDLFNPEKRQETLERTKLNFDLDTKPKMKQTIEEESELLVSSKTKSTQMRTLEPSSSNHFEADVVVSIQDFLPQAQFKRIMERIQQELKPQHSIELIKSMEELHKLT